MHFKTTCSISCIAALIVISAFASTTQAGDPAFPGSHSLTQAQAGELLIAELKCAACHTSSTTSLLPMKTAPDLTHVGDRIAPDFLKRYLLSPATAHTGTMMPDVLASRPEAQKETIANALTHFLMAQSAHFEPQKLESQNSEARADIPHGKLLYHSVGCVACHGPMESIDAQVRPEQPEEDDQPNATTSKPLIKPIAISIAHVGSKYSRQSLSEFLFQPLHVRSSGRMPDMKLSRSEASDIAGYLLRDKQAIPNVPWTTNNELITQGEKYFRELNCAACHKLKEFSAAPLIATLKNTHTSRGCLSSTSDRSPRFHLNADQLSAIQAAMAAISRNEEEKGPKSESDTDLVAKTLVAFNCVACHIRDDFGGVHESHNSFFTTTEMKLGDDGRIPPPLTLVGAKLQSAWMKKVLFDGESIRPYMLTRMPQFGNANLHHLPDLFARTDMMPSATANSAEMHIPSSEPRTEAARQHEKATRTAGKELLGDKGLNCIACHQFNGKPAVSNQGMDLMTSYQRLQPGWFKNFLRNPGKYRPRIIMPTAWPDNVATLKTVLDGDTDKQIEAIWYYLSLGTSAADPSGIRAVTTKLAVQENAKLHRGRSRIAGFRGIAVGLPEKVNYAFNAETGSITAIWEGDFISVNWSGQGSGDFNPLGQPRNLPPDVSFAKLADSQAPWPLLPVITKDAKTNPNPLYPKDQGYQFRGYYFDGAHIPTFMYRSGDIDIEDRCSVTRSEEPRQLLRVFQFVSPSPQSLWFRALTGDITKTADQTYLCNGLRLTIPNVETHLREIAHETNRSDLILKLQIPQGKSSLEFLYEPLPR